MLRFQVEHHSPLGDRLVMFLVFLERMAELQVERGGLGAFVHGQGQMLDVLVELSRLIVLIGDLNVGIDQTGEVGLWIELDCLLKQRQILVVASGSESGLGMVLAQQGLIFLRHAGADLAKHLVGLRVSPGVEIDGRPEDADVGPVFQSVGHGLGHLIDG
jgi:hypothetical protein